MAARTLVAALGLLFVSRTTVVNACSLAECTRGSTHPYAQGADTPRLPANVPALLFISSNVNRDPRLTDPDPVVLRAADGGVVATTVDADPWQPGAFLVHTPELALGGYTLERTQASCGASVGAVDAKRFEIVAAVDPLSSMGELARTSTIGQAAPSAEPRLPCYSGTLVRSAMLELALTPSPALEAFLPHAALELLVDGSSWARTRYGQATRLDGIGRELALAGNSPLLVFAACDPNEAIDNGWTIALGKHHGSLRAHVAGAASDPAPIEFDFELACDSGPAGTTGCDYAPGGGSGGAALALAALAWIGSRRRRAERGPARGVR